VSCRFSTGHTAGLIGDNGVGKTTLLRTATTLLTPSRGEVLLSGKPLLHDDLASRSRIGALIEQPGHYDELTVVENLEFFYSFHASAGEELTRAVSDAVERFALQHVKAERVGRLSTGYRQRVAVARAFHPNARVVLLDEPFSGLDPTTRNQLKGTIQHSASRGVALVISSHGLSDLEALCDELFVMAGGRLHHFADFSAIRKQVGAARETDLDAVYTSLIAQLAQSAN
jgi:ABC-type multidrug transport system ATPase subunit